MSFDRGDGSSLIGTSVTSVSPGAKGNVLTSNGTTWEAKPVLTRETELSLNGLTSVTFTDIPAGVKKIEVMFHEVSSNGINIFLVQLGTSSGIETTNYTSVSNFSSTTSSFTDTTGFRINNASASSVDAGILTLFNMYGNCWIASSILEYVDGASSRVLTGAGQKTLSGTLAQIKFSTTSTDTFDGGKINIMYTF